MKSTTVARNYAEALLTAAQQLGQTDLFGRLMDALAGAIQSDESIAVVLDSPRVAKAVKAHILAAALEGEAPVQFVRFLQAVVRRGRQGLLGEIAQEYQGLVDLKENRVHAGVTLATPADDALQRRIVERLGQVLGKEVRAHFRPDPRILGGVVVRVGDRVYDGSLKRRLNLLRRRMMTGE
ncbi:MAG TPA: ATP synthase F1 subunit delta [Gemmatimonadales bacterium]|nr:ATP synthase F1 subunit delta [Gemmatimonadales bacterium]